MNRYIRDNIYKQFIHTIWVNSCEALPPEMVFYKEHLLELKDGFIFRPSYLSLHWAHSLRNPFSSFRLDSFVIFAVWGRLSLRSTSFSIVLFTTRLKGGPIAFSGRLHHSPLSLDTWTRGSLPYIFTKPLGFGITHFNTINPWHLHLVILLLPSSHGFNQCARPSGHLALLLLDSQCPRLCPITCCYPLQVSLQGGPMFKLALLVTLWFSNYSWLFKILSRFWFLKGSLSLLLFVLLLLEHHLVSLLWVVPLLVFGNPLDTLWSIVGY